MISSSVTADNNKGSAKETDHADIQTTDTSSSSSPSSHSNASTDSSALQQQQQQQQQEDNNNNNNKKEEEKQEKSIQQDNQVDDKMPFDIYLENATDVENCIVLVSLGKIIVDDVKDGVPTFQMSIGKQISTEKIKFDPTTVVTYQIPLSKKSYTVIGVPAIPVFVTFLVKANGGCYYTHKLNEKVSQEQNLKSVLEPMNLFHSFKDYKVASVDSLNIQKILGGSRPIPSTNNLDLPVNTIQINRFRGEGDQKCLIDFGKRELEWQTEGKRIVVGFSQISQILMANEADITFRVSSLPGFFDLESGKNIQDFTDSYNQIEYHIVVQFKEMSKRDLDLFKISELGAKISNKIQYVPIGPTPEKLASPPQGQQVESKPLSQLVMSLLDPLNANLPDNDKFLYLINASNDNLLDQVNKPYILDKIVKELGEMLSFFVLMKIDNHCGQNGINNRQSIFHHFYLRMTRNFRPWQNGNEFLPILKDFIKRSIDLPWQDPHIILCLGIPFLKIDPEIFSFTLHFAEENNILFSVLYYLKREISGITLAYTKILIQSFIKQFKIFEDDIKSDYKPHVDLFNKILQEIQPHLYIQVLHDQIAIVPKQVKSLVYRFHIYCQLLNNEKDFKDTATIGGIQNCLFQLFRLDPERFIKESTDKSTTIQNRLLKLVSDKVLPVATTGKGGKEQDEESLENNLAQSIDDQTSPPPPQDRKELFSPSHHDNTTFSTLQNKIIERMRVEELADLSLKRSQCLIPVPKTITTSSELIKKISMVEESFHRGPPDTKLSSSQFTTFKTICETITNEKSLENVNISKIFSDLQQTVPPTLIYILLATYQLEKLNLQHKIIVAQWHTGLMLINTDHHWNEQVEGYNTQKTKFIQTIDDIANKMKLRWKDSFSQQYTIIKTILEVVNKKIEPSEVISERYYKHVYELNGLFRLVDYLDQLHIPIQVKRDYESNHEPLDQIIATTKELITTKTKGTKYRVETDATIKFLCHFASSSSANSSNDTDQHHLFNIIFYYYDNAMSYDGRSMDDIVKEVSTFMKQLLDTKSEIPLNNIFKSLVVEESTINLQKELKSMYLFFEPHKPFNLELESQLKDFIQRAKSLFGYRDNIKYLNNFFETNNYLVITNKDKDIANVHEFLKDIDQEKMTLGQSKSNLESLKPLLAGLEYNELVIFEYINPSILQFFSQFGKDIKEVQNNFSTKNQILTTNHLSDTYNSALMNASVHTLQMIESFVELYLSKPVTLKSITDICSKVKSLTEGSNFAKSLLHLKSFGTNLPQIIGLYASAGGYDSGSIKASVNLILEGSEFRSTTSKSVGGSSGWLIATGIDNAAMKKEHTQEAVNDFVQGLKFFSKGEQMQHADHFENIVIQLRSIHELHTNLDRLYHQKYLDGMISIKVDSHCLASLQAKASELQKDLDDWLDEINTLPSRLWLLKIQGISSLIFNYNYFLKGFKIVDNASDTVKQEFFTERVNQLACALLPFIKYCYPYSLTTQEGIFSALIELNLFEDINKLPLTNEFFTKLIDYLDKKSKEKEISWEEDISERGPILVPLQDKNNLYNCLMQLNGFVLPHPSQLFYGSSLSKDFEIFKKIVEQYRGSCIFLVGIPSDKISLLNWLSDKYSSGDFKNLTRIYIITATKDATLLDLFSFIELNSTSFEKNWQPFKDEWVDNRRGVHSLQLVSGPSGTGKSFFIRSKRQEIASQFITVHVRPNYQIGGFIKKLKRLVKDANRSNKGQETVTVHFKLSPYCDFEAFITTIYPLITQGYIFGDGIKDFVSVSDHLKLAIFVEIGDPLLDAHYQSHEQYLLDTVSLIFNLSMHYFQPMTDWEIGDAELICLACHEQPLGYYQLPDQRKALSVKEPDFINFVMRVLNTFDYKPKYLKDILYLTQKKTFFKLLSERLEFLNKLYYPFYINIPTVDEEPELLNQSSLLPPHELFQFFVYESAKLADPIYSSTSSIWANPPLITARSKQEMQAYDEESGRFMDGCTVNYIALGPSDYGLEKRVETLITYDKVKNDTTSLRLAIATAFGIDKTNLIYSLCTRFKYVITADFAVRLIILHCKAKNTKSLVLTGDTGVGKTHNLLFYSLLINAMVLPDIAYDIKEYINGYIEQFPDLLKKYTVVAKVDDEVQLTDEQKKNVKMSDKRKERILLKLLPGSPPLEMVLEFLTHIADYDPDQEIDSVPKKQFSFLEFCQGMEKLVIGILEKNQLIDINSSQKALLAELKSNPSGGIITKKDQLFQCIKEIMTVNFKNLFERIIMHQKYSSDQFIDKVKSIIEQANPLESIGVDLKLVVFIDEFNTAPDDTLALINEVFTDGVLDGCTVIPDNIFWVGAMNEPKKVQGSDDQKLVDNTSADNKLTMDHTGIDTKSTTESFVVKPIPPSMRHLTLSYGEFSTDNETPFLESLFTLRPNICPMIKDVCSTIGRRLRIVTAKSPMDQFKRFILVGQDALRQVKQARTHVSIRDIYRVIDLYSFFRTHQVGISILNVAIGDTNNSEEIIHWWSMIVSMALSYYIRVDPASRSTMLWCFNEYLSQEAPRKVGIKNIGFLGAFNKVINSFCSSEYTTLPAGIALTDTLKLNIFTIVVSINTCIPICIVGPPGSSKTLSFTIVLNNINANKNDNTATTIKGNESPWRLMVGADPFRYQCTPHTTDIEIKNNFENAINRQKVYNISGGKRATAFFDEAGLVNEFDSPMKIMHDYLDNLAKKIDQSEAEISIIILSNRILDAAKTSRMMMLMHPQTISNDDKMMLVKGCLFKDKNTINQIDVSKALCSAYNKVNTFAKSTKPDMFHQRDFVYFLHHLARGMHQNNNYLSPQVLATSIERNFGGVPPDQMKKIISMFMDEMAFHNQKQFINADYDRNDNTITRIQESLQEKLQPTEDPGTCPFRYIMLIDPTENESSLMVLKELGIKHKVIRVGGFENDTQTSSLIDVVSQIKNEMSEGETVVLVNTQSIDACFYDVFNRYFTKMPHDDKILTMANVSFGTHTVFCQVHSDFKIIVHLPQSRLPQTPLPWLNRFEKYHLSINTMVDHYISQNLPQHIEYFEKMKTSASHFVNEFHTGSSESLLCGFSETGTIPSLIYTIAKKLYESGSINIQPQRVDTLVGVAQLPNTFNSVDHFEFRLFNWKLLQIARPESVFRCLSMPKSYVEEFLLRQEHFNLFHFITDLFSKKFVKNENVSNRWILYTRSSLTLHHLKDIASDKTMKSFYDILLQSITEKDKQVLEIDKLATLQIIQLTSIKTSQQCQDMINEFNKDDRQKICLVIADMESINQHQVNFINEQFDTSQSSKIMVTICHYPVEFSLSNQAKLNSIFLNDTEYMYIDSFGVKIDSDLMEWDPNIRSWLSSAYRLDYPIDPTSLHDTFESMFFTQLRLVSNLASNNNYLGMEDDHRLFYLESKCRGEMIENLFRANSSWYKAVVTSFTNKWSEDDLLMTIISNISDLILTGKLTHSFIDSIKSSLESYFYPVISQVFKLVTNYQSYPSIESLDEPSSQLISSNIAQRYEPILLSRSPSKDLNTSIPLYHWIAQILSSLFEKVLHRSTNLKKQSTISNDPEIDIVYDLFVKCVKKDPFGRVVEYIDNNLLMAYQSDFIKYTLNIDRNDSSLIAVMESLFSVKHSGILQYTVAHHFGSSTINFVNNMTTPLLQLSPGNKIINQLTAKNLKNTETIKSTFSQITIDIIYDYVVKGKTIDPNNIVEWTSNWASSMTDLFNRVSLESLIKTLDKQDKLKAVYLSMVYQLVMNIAMTADDIDIPDRLKHIYNSVRPITLLDKCLLEITTQFSNNFNSFDISCYLDVIGPLSHSESILTDFLSIINIDGSFEQHRDYLKKIPFGWLCNIIAFHRPIPALKTHYRELINAKFVNLEIQANPVMLSLCSSQSTEFTTSTDMLIPSDQVLAFFKMNIEEFNQYPRNPPLIDAIYYNFVQEHKVRFDDTKQSELVDHWLNLCKKTDAMSKIELLALNTTNLEVFTSMLAKESSLDTFVEGLNLTENKAFGQIIKDLLYLEDTKEKTAQISCIWNRIFFFNKIQNESTLIQLVGNQKLLELLGLAEFHITAENIPNLGLLPFVYYPDSPDGIVYNKILKSVCDCSLDAFNEVLAHNSGTTKQQGFFRMSLFLISYQMYQEKKAPQTQFIKRQLKQSVIDKLSLAKYTPLFNKILVAQFDSTVVFDRLLMTKDDSPQDTSARHIWVNSVAIAIGSNNNSYLYHMVDNNPFLVAGEYYPACDGMFRDCGMQYEIGIEPKADCMNNNYLNKILVGVTFWSSFAWYVSICDEGVYEKLINKKERHFVNGDDFFEPKFGGPSHKKLVDYIHSRALTSFSHIINTKEIIDDKIEADHFVSELLYSIWNDCYDSRAPHKKSTFAGHTEVVVYENYLTEMIKNVRSQYAQLKADRLQGYVANSLIASIRQNLTNVFSSPLYEYQSIFNNLVNQFVIEESQTDGSPKDMDLLMYFTKNVSAICISKYFKNLIRFLKLFYQMFARRLPENYTNNTISEFGLKSPDISMFSEGGCRARPEYEKIIPPIDDTTLVSQLINMPELKNGGGEIIRLINNWMTDTQGKVVSKITIAPKSALFASILEKMTDRLQTMDIGEIPFDYGDNYLLLGSNFEVADYQKFLIESVSHYHQFQRTNFHPNLALIQQKLIYKFASGKSTGRQLKNFTGEFPFKRVTESKDQTIEKLPHSRLVPEPIKNLIDMKDQLESRIYAHEIEVSIFAPITATCRSKLSSVKLESFANSLVSTITRLVHKEKDAEDIGLPIMHFNSKFGIDNTNIPSQITKLLESIKINNIKTLADIVIQGYLSYGYLYSNVTKEPTDPNPDFIDHLNQMKNYYITAISGGGGLQIYKGIQYLKGIVQDLCSQECINDIKKSQPDHHLKLLFSHINNSSTPLDFIKVEEMTSPTLPMSYYAYFMRTLHEILSILYLDSQNSQNQIKEYNEPFITQFNDHTKKLKEKEEEEKTKQQLDESDEEVLTIEEKQGEGEEEQEKKNPELNFKYYDNNYCFLDEDDTKEEEEEQAIENEFNFSLRPILPIKNVDIVHCLFNWIRYANHNIPMMISKQKDLGPLSSLFQRFWSRCQKNQTSPIDISKLYLQFSIVTFTLPGDLLIQILSILAQMENDNGIKKLYSAKIQSICGKCKATVPDSQRNESMLFERVLPLRQDTNVQDLIKDIAKDQSSNTFFCKQCGTVNQIKRLMEAPQYLFVSFKRDNNEKEKHHLQYQETIKLDEYHNSSGIIYEYNIQSILCREKDLSNKEKPVLYIKHREQDIHLRCATTNSVITSNIEESLSRNCVLLIYEKVHEHKISTPEAVTPIVNETPEKLKSPTYNPPKKQLSSQPNSKIFIQGYKTTLTNQQQDISLSSKSSHLQSTPLVKRATLIFKNEELFGWIKDTLKNDACIDEIISDLQTEGIDTFEQLFSAMDQDLEKIKSKFSSRLKAAKFNYIWRDAETRCQQRPKVFGNEDIFNWIRAYLPNENNIADQIIMDLESNSIDTFDILFAFMDEDGNGIQSKFSSRLSQNHFNLIWNNAEERRQQRTPIQSYQEFVEWVDNIGFKKSSLPKIHEALNEIGVDDYEFLENEMESDSETLSVFSLSHRLLFKSAYNRTIFE
ncbi:hypothetical protein DFA_07460 [Cavenderia fasciculata]|uniref:Uncharacterized protein n=1 Tax=Cavenderia fasciculata TaxID=261658 RepID=F4PWH2_CACFS|nr:uncharacterized protein DFA_07460 [Cavenderia fasciculata]EGG20336.1 hypothetical protein DFA_07460 [Cavenderia fasciculata]|eukprot:XP_004367319.1 hypothetical protein DFA_07460 [Cavenderia fasciculata]